MVHYPAVNSHHKGMDIFSENIHVGCGIQMKLSWNHYTCTITPTPSFMQGRMDLCFYDVYAKFWHDHLDALDKIETRQSRQHVFSLLLSNFFCGLWVWWSVTGPQPVGLSHSLPFLYLADRTTPVWSSAAVAHLCKGLMCCSFRDGILHFLVVKSGCFIYCCFSIIWNHSSYFDLSTLTRHFCPHNCRCLDVFSSLGHSL